MSAGPLWNPLGMRIGDGASFGSWRAIGDSGCNVPKPTRVTGRGPGRLNRLVGVAQGKAVKGGPAVPAGAAEGPALDPAHHAVGWDAASLQAAPGGAAGGAVVGEDPLRSDPRRGGPPLRPRQPRERALGVCADPAAGARGPPDAAVARGPRGAAGRRYSPTNDLTPFFAGGRVTGRSSLGSAHGHLHGGI